MRNCYEEPKFRIRRQKWAWIGHTLRKDEDSIARMAMKWNPIDGLGRAPGKQCQTWRRAVERETKTLGKSWRELKLIARNRIQFEQALLMSYVPERIKDKQKKKSVKLLIQI